MDLELARTFLEIVSAGSLIKASERLHVTQTAVTVRIQTLEQLLDCQLFIRNRSGAKLTPEGEKFVQYATALVQTWERARNDVRLPPGHKARLSLGVETSLWNPLFTHWLTWIREHQMDVAVDSLVENAALLISQLENGRLDACVIHRPSYYSGFVVEQLLEEKLIHVQAQDQYEPNIFIHWGDEFLRQYDASLPQPRQNAFSFNPGLLALHTMLRSGGNGWFRTRVVEPYIASGHLVRVTGSPEFSYPVFLTYRSGSQSEELKAALSGLRDIIGQDIKWLI